ncbi:hypothetical protein [Streptomyces sp. NPDC053427]|uniref:hypothetical protein n=1 Tax=Streptomyces sp. NPDC053427 TaxID=3365701 RepID=UPI0037D512FA
MPPAGVPAPAPRSNTGRTCLTAALAVVGALALLGGGGLLSHAYSNASQSIPNRSEFGPSMWRNEPVDKIFPEALADKQDAQSDTADRKRAQWHRIGISDKTGCDEGLSSAIAAEAKKLGCKAVLRATYVDPTGNTVATVAVIVLPKGDTAKNKMGDFFSYEQDKHSTRDQVKAFGVPRTLAARWNDAARNGSHGDTVTEMNLPYALSASTGAADGRKAGKLPGEWGRHATGDAESDRSPWEGAAMTLVDLMNAHLGDLLLKETP